MVSRVSTPRFSTLPPLKNGVRCAATKCPVISTVFSRASRVKGFSNVTTRRAAVKKYTRACSRRRAAGVAGAEVVVAEEAVVESRFLYKSSILSIIQQFLKCFTLIKKIKF